ncbi:MAG TPA: glycoside hydrolase family 2 protein, partial [Puia sp.]|nr:glycoside hydrolase family 2 protein [Puia sp.]
YNMDGKPVAGLGKHVVVDAPSNAATACFDLGFSMDISPVHFIRLSLKNGSGTVVSDNFYWRGSQPNDYTGLNTLAPARLRVKQQLQRENGKAVITATVTNAGKSVAFAVRVQAVRTKDGERILPALMDDNYFTLLQGESKEIRIEFDEALLQGGGYQVLAQAYNSR